MNASIPDDVLAYAVVKGGQVLGVCRFAPTAMSLAADHSVVPLRAADASLRWPPDPDATPPLPDEDTKWETEYLAYHEGSQCD